MQKLCRICRKPITEPKYKTLCGDECYGEFIARSKRECTEIACLQCGKYFTLKRRNQVYCSSACRNVAWQLKHININMEEL